MIMLQVGRLICLCGVNFWPLFCKKWHSLSELLFYISHTGRAMTSRFGMDKILSVRQIIAPVPIFLPAFSNILKFEVSFGG